MDQPVEPEAKPDLLGRFTGRGGPTVSGLEVDETSDRQHVRIFVLSHITGPFIGLALCAFLLLLGFPADARLGGFTLLVCLFWAYPVALKMTGRYQPIAFISVQNLAFCVLWACYSYGGTASPFLPWILIFPLLAFL